jgi:predicted P-loop ATPase
VFAGTINPIGGYLKDPTGSRRFWAKHSFGPWLSAAAKRLHHNVLATAVANKLARIAWTVLVQGRGYETRVTSEAA